MVYNIQQRNKLTLSPKHISCHPSRSSFPSGEPGRPHRGRGVVITMLFSPHVRSRPPQPTPSQNKKLSFRGLTPESRSWCKIIMSLWNNGDHPAPVILVFRNRPILVHNNKKYDCSGVARVRSHCMAPIPACAGMNPSEAQDAARTQSAGDT